MDTHLNGGRLERFKGFISPGHDEYWTSEMFDAAEKARDSGTNLAFFGSNAVYWQVRLEPNKNGTANRTVTCYRDKELDPVSAESLKTDRFRSIGRPEQQLIGIQYVTYGSFEDNTAFIPQSLDHWIYEGSGFSQGDTVSGIVGYEVDIYDSEHPKPENLSYTLLSSSPYSGTKSVNSNAVIYQAPSEAWVFGSGTMSWSWALSQEGYENSGIQQMTKNLLDTFLA